MTGQPLWLISYSGRFPLKFKKPLRESTQPVRISLALSFVGEITILSGMERTSVTIETLTEAAVICFQRKDFEERIAEDDHFPHPVAGKVEFKLYCSSYNRGVRLFNPPQFILPDYILKYAAAEQIEKKGQMVIKKICQELYEEHRIIIM